MREIATATAFKTIVRGYVVGNCLFEFDEIQLEQDSSGAEQMFEMVMDSSRSGANAFGIIVSDSEGHRLPSMEVRRINFE
jgi:hypothetical protein